MLTIESCIFAATYDEALKIGEFAIARNANPIAQVTLNMPVIEPDQLLEITKQGFLENYSTALNYLAFDRDIVLAVSVSDNRTLYFKRHRLYQDTNSIFDNSVERIQ